MEPADLARPRRVDLLGVEFTALAEHTTIAYVLDAINRGQGGWVCPVNLDVLRQAVRDVEIHALVASADLTVADGMPLIWASRIQGTPLPERVAGSSLITTLSAALAAERRSVYLLGGNPGTAEAAGERLASTLPGLHVAGSYCPPFGFERDPAQVEHIQQLVQLAHPDVVFVGLGFPKQDRLIVRLREVLTTPWYVSCGISFSFVVGEVQRAPPPRQAMGLEWVHRLAQEPRRLARRYLVDGLPFAARRVAASMYRRVVGTN